MADRKTIVVFGATGAQGGGLVRAIQRDPAGGFVARAVTRSATSDKARALAALGAEVVEADLADAASVARAFEGAHGAYCVTFFWEHLSPDRELAEARMFADSAKRAGTAHVVWSTLDDTRKWVPLSDDRMPTLAGKYKVPHFDAKGEGDAFFAAAGVPTTYLLTSFYWDNLIHFGMGPKKDDSGRYVFTLPMGDARMPGIAAQDIGKCAYGIFKRGGAAVGQRIGIAGEHPTGAEMAATLAAVLGKPVVYNAIPPATYRGLGFPGADDLGNMFQFYHDFAEDFCRSRSIETARALNPELLSFRRWAEQNKDRIPLD